MSNQEPLFDSPQFDVAVEESAPKAGGTKTDEGGRPVTDEGGRVVRIEDGN